MRGGLGDFAENRKTAARLIQKTIKTSKGAADLLLFPEGGLFGYPPKDLLLQGRLIERQNKEITRLVQGLPPHAPALLLPAFRMVQKGQRLQNGAFLLKKHKPKKNSRGKRKMPLFFAKEFLPDDGVFCESRYFAPGKISNNTFTKKGKTFQVLICEDMWRAGKLKTSAGRPFSAIFCLNGSPYTAEKQKARLEKARALTRQCQCPFFYVNRAGGQDELIFDGGSFILDSQGNIRWQGAFFEPDWTAVDLPDLTLPMAAASAAKKPASPARSARGIIRRPFLTLEEQLRRAIKLGIQEFFSQTGFSKAVLGLSGGIDSALTACLAAEALGPENIHAMFLPGPYTRKISRRLAKKTAKTLGIQLTETSITPLWEAAMRVFFPAPLKSPGPQNPLTSQNLQSRIRAMALMAESNESGSLLLGTGNKSELSVGYSSLYGDLAGGLLPIGDLWKTEVYRLARHINRRAAGAKGAGKKQFVFPKDLLSREPSAELAPRQKDSSDLPPYPRLDPFLQRALHGGRPENPEEKKMASLLEGSEFKRRQAPPILKVSGLAFGEGRRMPIAYAKQWLG